MFCVCVLCLCFVFVWWWVQFVVWGSVSALAALNRCFLPPPSSLLLFRILSTGFWFELSNSGIWQKTVRSSSSPLASALTCQPTQQAKTKHISNNKCFHCTNGMENSKNESHVHFLSAVHSTWQNSQTESFSLSQCCTFNLAKLSNWISLSLSQWCAFNLTELSNWITFTFSVLCI